ncbi:hypothetical protein FHL15_001964 [Xylaria flabelliformis]|uniref:Replication protein A OB domain-containing protein n=1 Tax=Xylaria flabelliformis TaxID=2512241 RepID=A0A553IAE7_9PEZI|nr:hypothetical protein FHL15_001964 [Xylaria flabelliformis]
MSSKFPSIQSFYSREVAFGGCSSSSHPVKAGDGFTPSEVEAVTNPLSRPFQPSKHYDVCSIVELETGPHNYQISGRLVNFLSPGGPHRTSTNVEGYYFLVICDSTAAMAIKLYCNPNECQPLLGQRITLWATSISAGNQAEIGHIPYCSTATTIYPGRNGATHIEFHVDEPGSEDDGSLRRPVDVNTDQYGNIHGLMTLKSFLVSGHDLGEGRILVCVRSVGPRRTIQPKKREGSLHMVEVSIYDDTAHCVLKLWEDKITSAKSWIPNQTILLLSQPLCREYTDRAGAAHAEVGIGYSSIVNVDPDFPEAAWLRAKIQEMAKKERVIVPFPKDIWDLQLAMYGPDRTLYTLAELEEQARNQPPDTNFTGKPAAICKNCDTQRNLSLNPRILGSFLDESGMIAGSKLIWNDTAWTQFLFGSANEDILAIQEQENTVEKSWKDIAALGTNSLKDLEERLLYSRVTLTFGWSIILGRLCILGAEW